MSLSEEGHGGGKAVHVGAPAHRTDLAIAEEPGHGDVTQDVAYCEGVMMWFGEHMCTPPVA